MDLGNYEKFPDSDAFTTVYHPNIKINKLHDDARLPTYGSKNAACADLYAYIGFDEATVVDKDGNRCIMMLHYDSAA